jgi:hypothetical protein
MGFGANEGKPQDLMLVNIRSGFRCMGVVMLNEMPTQLGQISGARDGTVPVTAFGFLDMARVRAAIACGGLQRFWI